MFRHTVRCLSSLRFLPQVPSFMNLLMLQSQFTRAMRGYAIWDRNLYTTVVCVVVQVVVYFICVPVSSHHRDALASSFGRFTKFP